MKEKLPMNESFLFEDLLQPPDEDQIKAILAAAAAKFPTDEDAMREYFSRLLSQDENRCPQCHSHEVEQIDYRHVVCSNCGKKRSITAGTFFHGMKSPRAWMLWIFLLECGVVISSSRFHKYFSIAQSTALTIFKKLMMVVENEAGDCAFRISSAVFSSIYRKRTRETPAREHPVEEQTIIENEMNANRESQRDDSSGTNAEKEHEMDENSETWSDVQKRILAALTDAPLHITEIARLTSMADFEISAELMILTFEDAVVKHPGDCYSLKRATSPILKSIEQRDEAENAAFGFISRFVDFVGYRFHGIGRKYIQQYLMAYWSRLDRRRWRPGALFSSCFRSDPITYEQVLRYVSPPLVKILPFQI